MTNLGPQVGNEVLKLRSIFRIALQQSLMGLQKQLSGGLLMRHARFQDSKFRRVVRRGILYTFEEPIEP